ncbi:hypothetical protein ACIP6P_26860 [Streptomyces sp. NPDC088729]|uniref:hypothetical protein n=1 Tax=Streptomyces sp. NPDC088729 TaxID=3365876 RepID=UPI003800AB58
MTKSGHDHLKRQARAIARDTGRRFPDVLAELRRTPCPAATSKALVLVCSGFAHPIDGGRCARPAGHLNRDGGWGGCSEDPHYPVRIWEGYFEASTAAQHAQHDAWLASLTPQQRTEYEAEITDDYWSQMAAEAAEPYDPYEDKYRFAEPDDEPTPEDGYGPQDEYDDDNWDGDRS